MVFNLLLVTLATTSLLLGWALDLWARMRQERLSIPGVISGVGGTIMLVTLALLPIKASDTVVMSRSAGHLPLPLPVETEMRLVNHNAARRN